MTLSRRGDARSIIVGMSDADGVSIVLEMRRAAPVPTGRLHGPQGPPEAFEGWLQLLGALERTFEMLAEAPVIEDSDQAAADLA